jgi:2-iminobutanoate/2-iminopropanoate deaminase
MVEHYNPASMHKPFSPYSQGVEIPAGTRMIYVAGQVGIRADGTMSEDMADQTEQAFRNIQTVLREKGMDLEDLVETRAYLVSRADLPAYRVGRARVFGAGEDGPRPAAAAVFVSGLAQDHWKIEICAVAAKG